ncbi:MAG: autotransporter-associated beta strand repeat-containing protein [Prevotella sp.]|nr:autotransporter-associated beta strand repeat-containing protein [Prevotella sp.]
MKKSVIFTLSLCSLGCVTSMAQQLAFPEAAGWGRFATGGRTGSVYHVTNLNDSGTGSLRDAVGQANRIIVFDVAGVINLQSRLVFKNNLYVAGQTAPGEGITVYGNGVSFSGASNIIVRHMRFRMGHKGDSGKDCAGIANGTDMIFDHCSFSWGLDETFSINPDGKGTTPHNITLQNCVIGQGLMTHSAGGLMQADSITLYRNLYVDNSTRNNKVKGRNQYANNIVYNWQNGAYIMGGDSEGDSYCNIQSNLFINGPAVGGAAFTGGNGNFHCYGSDNWQDNNRNGLFDPFLITDYNAADVQATPYPYPALDLWDGNRLIELSLPTVGASLPYRDMADCYMVDEVMSMGTSGALISNEETLPYGAPNTWNVWQGNARTDTDRDGMPDAWEERNGTNPNANDAMTIAANGYANIENYINSITADDRDLFLRAPVALIQSSATTTTVKLSWRDYTYAEDGFIVEIDKGNGYEEAGRTAANVSSYTIGSLESGKTYPVRVKAYSSALNLESAYTSVSADTRLPDVGVIDIDTYQPDAVNAIEPDKNILIDSQQDMTLTLSQTVAPANVVVNSPAHITIDGAGNIGGSGSMNKAGQGTLTIATANTHTGATVLHEGVLEFSTLKNGGVASGLGAGIKDAQNWIMDGGTYRYTGSSTATDRSAKLTRQTTLDIATSGANVTMNGSIEGTAALVIDGKGQISVGTTSFFKYTGNTILRSGTLYLSATDISKAGIGKSPLLVMAGGTLRTKGESSGYETYAFPINVAENTTSIFAPNRNCYINSKVTGNGTLQIDIPYLREYVQGDWSGFSGRLVANGVSTDSRGSLLLLDKTPKMDNTIIELRGNANLCYWSTTGNLTIGGLSGTSSTRLNGSSKQTNNFTCTWSVGSANSDETFAGVINNWSCSGSGHTGTVNINKVGTGTWRLTGTNDYKGTTAVIGGTLVVNGKNNGTGAVSVRNGATLAGKGTIAAAVTVQNGGTLLAGDTLVNKTGLTLNGGLTLQSGATMEIPVYANGSEQRANKLTLKGNVSINNATLVVNMANVQGQLVNDVNMPVLNLSGATVTGSGFTTIVPERPSATQLWDTSDLLTKGWLRAVEDATGIDTTEADTQHNGSQAYKLNGQPTDTHHAKGLYISNGKKYIAK